MLYLALGKKTQLQALCKAVRNEKLQTFLGHDFSEPRWRTAAMKNAFALITKQQFGLAAAFFLLGGNLESAVKICARQSMDLQLALVLCRLQASGAPALLAATVREELLPLADSLRDRWLACVAHLLLGEAEAAIAALATEASPPPTTDTSAVNVPASLGVSPSVPLESCAAAFCGVVARNPRFRLQSLSVPMSVLFQCAHAYQQAGMPLAALETLQLVGPVDSVGAADAHAAAVGLRLSAAVDLLLQRSREIIAESSRSECPSTPRRFATTMSVAASKLDEELQVREEFRFFPLSHTHRLDCSGAYLRHR